MILSPTVDKASPLSFIHTSQQSPGTANVKIFRKQATAEEVETELAYFPESGLRKYSGNAKRQDMSTRWASYAIDYPPVDTEHKFKERPVGDANNSFCVPAHDVKAGSYDRLTCSCADSLVESVGESSVGLYPSQGSTFSSLN